MTAAAPWRTGVRVVRAGALRATRRGPGRGRATVFDFAETGGRQTWIGTATLPPGGGNDAHHHGRHEVALYVVKGRTRIRWGDRLEYAADLGPGDFAYFTPYVPHRERNLDDAEPVDFVVVRSDDEGIVVGLDVVPVEPPEMVV